MVLCRESRVRRSGGTLRASDARLGNVIARHTFDPPEQPLLAAVDRPRFPVGERGLRKHAGLHRHIVFEDDYTAHLQPKRARP